MVRSGMRQATQHFQPFFLLLGPNVWRAQFIEALKANPPDAVLVTEQGLDDWPDFVAAFGCCCVLAESRTMDGPFHLWLSFTSVSWRLYLRRN